MTRVLIIGSGIAGLTCALTVARLGGQAVLITPGRVNIDTGEACALAGGNSALAQGGIAAALGADDSPLTHANDTIAVGGGLVAEKTARELTRSGAASVRQLISRGFPADHDTASPGLMRLVLGLEAGHQRARIVHAGEDRTGAALHGFLIADLLRERDAGRVQLIELSTAVSVLRNEGQAVGAMITHHDGTLAAVHADAVVLATGGFGALYSMSSNHPGAEGAGIRLAAHLGAVVADLEFVQFHPTVLAGTGALISEAVRGAGAVLRDGSGSPVMRGVHPAGDLAPRDVVSRAIHRVLRERGEREVWLDATPIERTGGNGTLTKRFPTLTAVASSHGFDWSREPIPVTPAAHYTMGGVATDLDGRTSIPGLFAAGEVAATGVHGANRLASNSLLEGLVFGERAATAAIDFARPPTQGGSHWEYRGTQMPRLLANARTVAQRPIAHPLQERPLGMLRHAMSEHLGIERDEAGLEHLTRVAEHSPHPQAELVSMVARAALARTESRGSHQRSDYPITDEGQQHRTAWQLTSGTPTMTPHRKAAVC